jgi:hypothetical protein
MRVRPPLVLSSAVLLAVLALSASPTLATPSSSRIAVARHALARSAGPVDRVRQLARGAEMLGTSKFANSYAGYHFSSRNHVIIYLAKPADGKFTAIIHHLALRAGTIQYPIVTVRHSWAALNGLTMRIYRDRGYWDRRGMTIVRWGPDAASNKVLIHLKRYNRRTANAIISHYRSEWVTIGPTSSRRLPVLLDRYHDLNPFWGGDAIWPAGANPGVWCTSGFAFADTAVHRNVMTTAGHCHIDATWFTNYTDHYTLGSTLHNYGPIDVGGTDIQTMSCRCRW